MRSIKLPGALQNSDQVHCKTQTSNARRHSWGGGAYTASAAHWRCCSRHPLVLSCLLVPAIADPVCKCNANIKLPSALQNSDQVQCNTSWSQNGYGGGVVCSVFCALCSNDMCACVLHVPCAFCCVCVLRALCALCVML